MLTNTRVWNHHYVPAYISFVPRTSGRGSPLHRSYHVTNVMPQHGTDSITKFLCRWFTTQVSSKSVITGTIPNPSLSSHNAHCLSKWGGGAVGHNSDRIDIFKLAPYNTNQFPTQRSAHTGWVADFWVAGFGSICTRQRWPVNKHRHL